jgi:signal transduction histidine kinase
VRIKTFPFKTGASRPDGPRLALLLLLVVLAPSVCLFWFMNRAVHNERLAVRQKLADAYRGHLALAQEKLEAHWRQCSIELEAEAIKRSAPELFASQIRAGSADALVCYGDSGVLYPSEMPFQPSLPMDAAWERAQVLEAQDPEAAAATYARMAEQETSADTAGQAFQAQARCLIRAGKKEQALEVLRGTLAQERFRGARDAQGRLLAPSAELMALELFKDSQPAQARATLESLCSRFMDYSNSAMTAAQRRFLMRQTRQLFPGQTWVPSLESEDTAARHAESGQAQLRKPVLGATALPDVWQFGSQSGRVVQLHWAKNLVVRMRKAIDTAALPSDARIDFLAPGKSDEDALLSLAAGPAMPGWHLSLTLKDRALFDSAGKQRITWDVWIGILVVAAVSVLATAALRLIRRQSALAQLKNDLVANVTHELKTPLSSMRLLVDTLLNSERLNEQTAREYLHLIAQENERLSRLIDNFLTFSRIERNKYTFDFRTAPASRIAEAAAASIRERFNASGCQFTLSLPPDLPAVIADEDAMVTALLNLLENAHKYTGDNKRIELSAGTREGAVFFAVKDNGIGLSPRDAKQIFKRFFQVDQRLSRTAGGCGLGLSIVSFIVTAHRGSIEVQSAPGRGSVFTLVIPAAAREREEKT